MLTASVLWGRGGSRAESCRSPHCGAQACCCLLVWLFDLNNLICPTFLCRHWQDPAGSCSGKPDGRMLHPRDWERAGAEVCGRGEHRQRWSCIGAGLAGQFVSRSGMADDDASQPPPVASCVHHVSMTSSGEPNVLLWHASFGPHTHMCTRRCTHTQTRARTRVQQPATSALVANMNRASFCMVCKPFLQ